MRRKIVPGSGDGQRVLLEDLMRGSPGGLDAGYGEHSRELSREAVRKERERERMSTLPTRLFYFQNFIEPYGSRSETRETEIGRERERKRERMSTIRDFFTFEPLY